MPQVDVDPFEIDIVDRFGQTLKADVYLPKGADGPLPTLLAASPYQKALRDFPAHWMFPFSEYGPMQLYLDHGYAYVILDLPGSGVSEGVWDPWSPAEGESAHDAIEDIATRDWSTGKIGMIGQSYFAMSQWNTARTRPPHLTTIVPYDGANDHYRDWMYQGGIPMLGFLGSWLTGSVMYQHHAEGHDPRGGDRHLVLPNMMSHPFDDEWQRTRAPFWDLPKIDVPTFSIGVWGKGPLHLRGNVNGFQRVSGPKKLLIAEPDTFAGAQTLFHDVPFHEREILPWYEHHLKGVDNGVMDGPDVRYFVKNANRIAEAADWPPAGTAPVELYLSGEKSDVEQSLNDGALGFDAPADDRSDAASSTSWSYPDPLWMAGTTTLVNGMPDHVARVNTFTTAPLDERLECAGDGFVLLHASSDQEDLEVFAKLILMSAPGARKRPWQKLTQGWLRASHRREDPEMTSEMRPFHRHDRAEKIVPGEPVELRVALLPMAFVVEPGERLRLELTNADSAALDQPMIHWYGQKVGTDTYHHDAARPSRLVLPRVG